MIRSLLSPQECADCKLCCSFDSSDIWEAPVIDGEKARLITSRYKEDQQFIDRGTHCVLKMEKQEDSDLYYCTMLDHAKGCIMGSEKPFDCKIWPFRIMELNGMRVITLSPVCPIVNTRPIEQIKKTCGEIADTVFAEAEKHPEYVKPYIDGYPIIAAESR